MQSASESERLPPAEQRGSARSPVRLPLEFTAHGCWDLVRGMATDLSLGGMFIQTRHPAPSGQTVVVRLTLCGSKRAVVLPAVVRWTKHDGMGVQFAALGARQTHVLLEMARAAR